MKQPFDTGSINEASVRTPWGDASELKARRLFPGSGTPPDVVSRNQLERLYGAIVAVVSEKGYEGTTVADIIELCGVSRSDFYKHFANKTACLTAAVDSLLAPALRDLCGTHGGDVRQAPREVFDAFIGMVCAQPAAARVFFVDLHAAGAEGDAVADRGFEAVVDLVDRLGDQHSMRRAGGLDLTRSVLGGLRKLVHTRLYRGQHRELLDLGPDLWRWVESVEAPPRALEKPRRQRMSARPSFEGYTPAERIARAVARVVTEKGYGATATDDIAAAASISLSTFYDNFVDKRDAVLAALEMSGAQIAASAVPAARRAGDWCLGVRTMYEAMSAYFAAEPEMTRLAMVGVYGAGPEALARRDRVIDSLSEMLGPGFEANPNASPASAEAVGATVYALMREQVRREGPASIATVVPLATYITLVGFVGPDEALAVANGERRRAQKT